MKYMCSTCREVFDKAEECEKHEKEQHCKYRHVLLTIGDLRFKPQLISRVDEKSTPYLIPNEKLELVDWAKDVNGYTVEVYSKNLSKEKDIVYTLRVLDAAEKLCEKELKIYRDTLEYIKHEEELVKEGLVPVSI